MKALSVRQPWAGFIVAGIQDVENRAWQPKSLPGKILIHASTVPINDVQSVEWAFQLSRRQIELPASCLYYGGIIGSVEVTGTTNDPNYPSIWRNYEHAEIGWLLENATPLEFVQCRGNLGLFDVDYDQLLRRKVYASKIGR